MDAVAFLTRYGFELGGRSAADWVGSWEKRFPRAWVASALVEALYQGRYKAISVEQLLKMWKSRGCPCLQASLEFGRKVWPENLDRLQVALEEGAHTSIYPARSYAFDSFDVVKLQATDRDAPITISPLCRQLRREILPTKLQALLTYA